MTAYDDAIIAAGPFAYWLLNEDSGATDVIGGLDGTVNGAVFSTESAPNLDGSYYFDGVDDYIDLDHDGLCLSQDQWSVELWFRHEWDQFSTEVEGNWRYLYAYADEGHAIYQVSGRGMRGSYYTSGGTRRELTKTIDGFSYMGMEAWHHVVAVYDGTRQRFYWNGNQSSSTRNDTGLRWPNTASDKAAIGRKGRYSTNYFNGHISRVAVYKRALTANECCEHFLLGADTSGVWDTSDFAHRVYVPQYPQHVLERPELPPPPAAPSSATTTELWSDPTWLTQTPAGLNLYSVGNDKYLQISPGWDEELTYTVLSHNTSTDALTVVKDYEVLAASNRQDMSVARLDATTFIGSYVDPLNADAPTQIVLSWDDGSDTLSVVSTQTLLSAKTFPLMEVHGTLHTNVGQLRNFGDTYAILTGWADGGGGPIAYCLKYDGATPTLTCPSDGTRLGNRNLSHYMGQLNFALVAGHHMGEDYYLTVWRSTPNAHWTSSEITIPEDSQAWMYWQLVKLNRGTDAIDLVGEAQCFLMPTTSFTNAGVQRVAANEVLVNGKTHSGKQHIYWAKRTGESLEWKFVHPDRTILDLDDVNLDTQFGWFLDGQEYENRTGLALNYAYFGTPPGDYAADVYVSKIQVEENGHLRGGYPLLLLNSSGSDSGPSGVSGDEEEVDSWCVTRLEANDGWLLMWTRYTADFSGFKVYGSIIKD